MQNLKILNAKEKKEVLKKIYEQWGADFKTELVMMRNSSDKFYLIDRDFQHLPTENIRVDTAGLYFAKEENAKELRLTIEGSQIIGPLAKKNVLSVTKEQMRALLKGYDIEVLPDENEYSGFLIIKHEADGVVDYLGTAKYKAGRILNYTPKTRQIAGAALQEE